MIHRPISGLLFSSLFFSISCMALPLSDNQLAVMINERLSYMKDVAGYKAEHHLPVEDLSQESLVLLNVGVEAGKTGLDSDSTKVFIQAQMDAAKAIQYRYRADWLSMPEKTWHPKSLEWTREKIGTLNHQILQAISLRLKKNEPSVDKNIFMNSLHEAQLTTNDKERLWKSLNSIAMKKK